jgi:Domain of unknown function (DUF4157)
MKTTDNQKSTNHQPAAQKPFFGAGTEHAFFSAERAPSTPFFQPKASSPPAFQPKSANSDDIEKLNQERVEEAETSTVQRIPEFPSKNNQVQAHTEHPLLTLQRQLGNRAVTQMIQAKLTVGKPHDHYEQEADRVANTVMRMPSPLVQRQGEDKKEEVAQIQPLVGSISSFVQRQADEKEEPAQAKSLIGTITPIAQRQPQEEKKEEVAQTLQRQAAEEKKEEPGTALQRQAPEEKKEEVAQTLQRQAAEEKKEEVAQTKATGEATPAVSSNLESSIQSMQGSGQPMPDSTRTFFESRFGHDFSGVRLHTDANASEAAKQLNAEAFTIKQDVFFNSGRYEPQMSQGKWLLAHELTHTVQQAPQPLASAPTAAKPDSAQPGFPVAGTPSAAIAQRQPLTISSAVPQVQRLGLDTILNWVADHAANIPGFTMLTVLLGRNPINNRPVERSGINLVRGLMGLVPSGDLIFRTLQETGVVDRAFSWLNTQVQQLNITWDGIKVLFQQAWDAVSIWDGFEGAFAKIRGIFSPTVQRVMNFASSIVGKVIGFIKEAILQPVGQFVKEKVPGYKLLTVILGKDPVTGEPVERNATNFIGGFLELIPGGKETFKNLQESGAIARATTWLEQQIKGLNLTWEGIKALFSQAWNVLAIADLTSPLKAFSKIQTIFSPPIQRLSSFAVAVGKKVLEFVFEGVLKLAGPFAGAIMGAVKQSGDVFAKIIQNPIGFAGNLIKAVKQGFQQFSSNILTHLKTGLMGWLFGALATAGIAIPQKFDLEGIVSLVLQVLGATYARLREVLVKLVGEKTVARIEQVFDFLVTIATKGLSAAWEKITEFVGSLGDMVIGAIKDWVVTKVVTAAITKLVSMFNPAGAIIQAIMSIYNTIAFFMERAQQIAMLVTAVTQSIGSIAAGAIGNAANFVELSMAKAIPVILGFLARFLGLGNVAEPIQKAIKTIQDKVWGAITKLANFIVSKAKSLLGIGKDQEAKPDSTDPEHDKKVQAGLDAIDQEEEKHLKAGGISREDAEKVAATVKVQYPVFQSLTVVDKDTSWGYNYTASPSRTKVSTHNKVGNSTLLSGEGQVGTYGQLITAGTRGDDLTPHHIPADSFMKQFKAYNRNDGVAIMMEQPKTGGRHRRTRSYGSGADLSETPLTALKEDIKDVRNIYRNDGLLTPTIVTALDQVQSLNLTKFPKIFTH